MSVPVVPAEALGSCGVALVLAASLWCLPSPFSVRLLSCLLRLLSTSRALSGKERAQDGTWIETGSRGGRPLSPTVSATYPDVTPATATCGMQRSSYSAIAIGAASSPQAGHFGSRRTLKVRNDSSSAS
jgi:hypothetical protein